MDFRYIAPRIEREEQDLQLFQHGVQAVGEPDRLVSRQEDLETFSRERAEASLLRQHRGVFEDIREHEAEHPHRD